MRYMSARGSYLALRSVLQTLIQNPESGYRLENTCSQRFSITGALKFTEAMEKISYFILVVAGLACASILYFVAYALFRVPFL